jgi:outer membrane receptor protein involved in Fe transport
MVDATLSGTWRYWGDVTYENLSSDVGLNAAPDLFIRKMDAVNYFDLSGLWNVNDNFSLRGGVNNVFDQDPPLVPNAIVGGALPNAYPLYDLLGRKFFMGITARF